MTKQPRSVSPEQTLADAARLMWEGDCGCLPVVDTDRRVIGVLTDRDICLAAYFKGQPLHEIPVESTMSRLLTTCRPFDTVEAAEVVMSAAQVRRLPVTDDAGRLVGILSLNDIAREAERAQSEGTVDGVPLSAVALTLSAVSRPHESEIGRMA